MEVKSITSNFKKSCLHLADEDTAPRDRPWIVREGDIGGANCDLHAAVKDFADPS